MGYTDAVVRIDNDGTVTFHDRVEIEGSVEEETYRLSVPGTYGAIHVTPNTTLNGVNISRAVSDLLRAREDARYLGTS